MTFKMGKHALPKVTWLLRHFEWTKIKVSYCFYLADRRGGLEPVPVITAANSKEEMLSFNLDIKRS